MDSNAPFFFYLFTPFHCGVFLSFPSLFFSPRLSEILFPLYLFFYFFACHIFFIFFFVVHSSLCYIINANEANFNVIFFFFSFISLPSPYPLISPPHIFVHISSISLFWFLNFSCSSNTYQDSAQSFFFVFS